MNTPVKLAENPRTAIQARIKRATKAAQIDTNKLDARALAAVESAYQRAAADLRSQIAARAGAGGNVGLGELRSLLSQTEMRLQDLGRQRDALLAGNIEQAAALGVRPMAQEAVVTAAAAMQIRDDALSFVRTFVAADGLQLSDRIWRLDRHAREAVTGAIEQAVIQGYSGEQAAAEFLSRGDAVPPDVLTKIDAAGAGKIGGAVEDVLVRGAGSPMDNALKLFRTEINRAHGVAYQKTVEALPDAAGTRFLLSPNHPRPDICDLLASQNLYGLGPGVYPKGKSPWPAHPNTLSYEEVVFTDEVSAADREGKQTSMQALEALTPAQQQGVLGVNKYAAFKAGDLKQNMIRSPWKSVQRRVEKIGQGVAGKAVQAVNAVRDEVRDGISWLAENISASVELVGVTDEQLASIRAGFRSVMKGISFRVGSLKWKSGGGRANASYGHFVFGHRPGVNDMIEINRGYANAAADRAALSRAGFQQNKAGAIALIELKMQNPTLTPSETRALKRKLSELNAMTRWSASSIADDPLSVTAAHEAGHAVYYSDPRIDQIWRAELQKKRVPKIDKLRVSEYAAVNHKELFAEVTAFIAMGRRTEIPDKILRAYELALRKGE